VLITEAFTLRWPSLGRAMIQGPLAPVLQPSCNRTQRRTAGPCSQAATVPLNTLLRVAHRLMWRLDHQTGPPQHVSPGRSEHLCVRPSRQSVYRGRDRLC
jgi:hypothetical protein